MSRSDDGERGVRYEQTDDCSGLPARILMVKSFRNAFNHTVHQIDLENIYVESVC